MSKGVKLEFDLKNGTYEVIKQTNPDLVDLIPVYGYYGSMHYDIKAKENCWAYVTAIIQVGSNWGDGADGMGGHATILNYGYWQPLTKGTIYPRGGAHEYTIYPIKK